MLSESRLIYVSLIYRLVNCWLVQTWFVPDEYWQSVEPAHYLVFGNGELPWEWREGLRTYLYPLVFATMYKILAIVHLDTRFFIVNGPRLIQSLLATVADVYLYKFARQLYGEKAAVWTLLCYWLNWFTFFCSTRTLANTVEAQLTIIGLYYYPWPANRIFDSKYRPSHSSSLYMTIVAIATIIRPTAAVFWLPLCLWHLFRSRRLFTFLFSASRATLPVVSISVAVDSVCYGYFVISLWQFLLFNVLQGGSAHFGVHPWHWYISNCLPTICLTHLIPIIYGIRETKDYTMLALCTFYVYIHSFLAHKELRFLLPLLAPLCTYCGRYLDIISRRNSHWTLRIGDYVKWAPKRATAVVAFLFVTNLPLIIYTGLFHQRGALDITRYLHDEAHKTSNRSMLVWFLTPCYHSPGFSHIHSPIKVRMLDCSPNLTGSLDYVDEADSFHDDPAGWMDREFSTALPTHVVLYEWLWRKIAGQKLGKRGYRICARFHNTHFPQSKRQSEYILVACS